MAFAQQNENTCKCYVVYIKEAHFVERDQNGKIVDGWPIGFFEYEYPQHKNQGDRCNMANLFKEKYNINIPILLDIYPQNLFDETFGIWPDNVVAFKNNKLVFRGQINLDGMRNEYHSRTLAKKLPTLKY